jgi:hypothetical protein
MATPCPYNGDWYGFGVAKPQNQNGRFSPKCLHQISNQIIGVFQPDGKAQ